MYGNGSPLKYDFFIDTKKGSAVIRKPGEELPVEMTDDYFRIIMDDSELKRIISINRDTLEAMYVLTFKQEETRLVFMGSCNSQPYSRLPKNYGNM